MAPVLIAGLGNPGTKYAGTRHNVGWMLIDLLAEKLGVKLEESPFEGLLGKTQRRDREIVMLKPTTYMNLSGESILPCVQHFGVESGNVLVAVDEVQFPVGRIRLSAGGSDSGHNGTASVIESLESADFKRLRIGVGAPPKGEMKDYVLSSFTEEEQGVNQETLELAADAILDWTDSNADDKAWSITMGRYNARNVQPAFRLDDEQAEENNQEEPLSDEKEHS